MVWCQVQRQRLVVFDRHHRHAPQTEIVKMVYHVFKVNVRLAAPPTVNVTAMSVVRVVFASHYVGEMMTVAMERCVKTLFVQPDVVQMLIAQAIWLALVKNALTHVMNQRLVDQMPTVSLKIT